jgi:hypothetical protein
MLTETELRKPEQDEKTLGLSEGMKSNFKKEGNDLY